MRHREFDQPTRQITEYAIGLTDDSISRSATKSILWHLLDTIGSASGFNIPVPLPSLASCLPLQQVTLVRQYSAWQQRQRPNGPRSPTPLWFVISIITIRVSADIQAT